MDTDLDTDLDTGLDTDLDTSLDTGRLRLAPSSKIVPLQLARTDGRIVSQRQKERNTRGARRECFCRGNATGGGACALRAMTSATRRAGQHEHTRVAGRHVSRSRG